MSPNKPNSNKAGHQRLVGKTQPILWSREGTSGWSTVAAAIQGDVTGREEPALASASSPHCPLGAMPKSKGAS